MWDPDHRPHKCAGRVCPIHSPTDHGLRGWRTETYDGILYRVCWEHQQLHLDPDMRGWVVPSVYSYCGVPRCCGCCNPNP